MLSLLFIAALWSPAWKGLTYWLLFVIFKCVFVTFPCGILGQVWYLIVSIPDLCRLSSYKPVLTWLKKMLTGNEGINTNNTGFVKHSTLQKQQQQQENNGIQLKLL